MACAAIVLRGCSEIGVADLPQARRTFYDTVRAALPRAGTVRGEKYVFGKLAAAIRRSLEVTLRQSESSQARRSVSRFHLGGFAGLNFGR
jgi:hypothetical protein